VKLTVDRIEFTFPNHWIAARYDEWSFYRNQFVKMRDGIKAVDLIVCDNATQVWFIEVKDYQNNVRTKPSEIAEEVARKVFDTLAALLPAQANANDRGEQQMATRILKAKTLRVVLHLEQPSAHSRLFPRAIDPANVTQKLKRLLKAIDAHPLVVEMAQMRGLPWQCT
jgi:hypothetical protein